MSNNKITVPFVACDSEIPMIELKIGDVTTHAIIDTGAGSTLIGSDVLNTTEVCILDEDVTANFTGIGEYKSKKILQLGVPTTIDGHEFDIAGYEFDLNKIIEHFERICDYHERISFILGSDFLTQHDTVIDYENKLVTMTV